MRNANTTSFFNEHISGSSCIYYISKDENNDLVLWWHVYQATLSAG